MLQLELFLPYRLNRISSVISQQFRDVYSPDNGLTVPEWRVLATLAQFGRMTATAIGSHSSMHKTKVSRAVRALEERRWLERHESPADRREESLGLTRAGQRAHANIIPKALAFEANLLSAFGPRGEDFLSMIGELEQALELTAPINSTLLDRAKKRE